MTKVVDIFYAIDFDRCLSDTPKLDELFYQLVGEHKELDVETLTKARHAVEDNGNSFDQIGALEKLLSESKLDIFFEELIKRGKETNILSDGAKELIESLQKNALPFGIVSYGDPRWQAIKIKASGVEMVPTFITDHKHKARVIADWQQDDKTFLIPTELSSSEPIKAKTVVLLDDKAVAFDGLPEEARGYWVQPLDGKLLPAQRGSVPENVRIVRGLRDVVSFESL